MSHARIGLRRLTFALFFLLLATLAACGERNSDGSSGSPAYTADGRSLLRRGNGAEPQTLDPHRAQDVGSAHILRDLYEGLISEAPDGTLVPGAAKSWTISEDGKTYEFELREAARWSNGDPVTAHDFVWSLRRSVDPATGSSYAQILAPIANAESVIAGEKPPRTLGVKAINDYTLRIRLNAPTPYFLGLLTHSSSYPVHRKSVEKYGDQFTKPGNLIGNGAYELTEWVVFSHIRVERNPRYWDNANTEIEVVDYLAIDNLNSELKRYRAGELDMTANVPLEKIDWIKSRFPGEYHASPYLGTYYYGLNLSRPPFKNNPKLRKALSLVIDREVLTDKITRGGELPAWSWVPPGVKNYTSPMLEYAEWTLEERWARARELFDQAIPQSEQPLRIEFRYNTSENHKKVATVIAAMWRKALGVEVSLINEEWKVFLQNVNAKRVTEVYRAGWIGDYNDPYTFLELLHSKFGLNGTGYANPAYDRLLENASVEADIVKRRTLLQRAEKMLLKDHAIIPLYFYVTQRLIKPYVRGYIGNIMNHHYSKNFSLAESESDPERARER